MRDEILDSLERMSDEDLKDVQITFDLRACNYAFIREMALADEDIAEYVLQF